MHSTLRGSRPLAGRLEAALASGDSDEIDRLGGAEPLDARDRLATLHLVYDLHTAALEVVGEAARWQHHPAVAALKQRCEAQWLAQLEATPLPGDIEVAAPVAAVRALAARDRLPAWYRWLARDADWQQVVAFLALEGGPDADFDDLVATCQLGLSGSAKLELATNYWDEMGNGEPAAVHTRLYEELVVAVDMPRVPLAEQPTAALARSALCRLLATNRWLQPELLGALGLIELQAGPRCRLVLQAFDRCDAPAAAYPFYEVHADVDPRHGKDWLEKAIAPTVAAHPEWGPRVVRGALWRSAVDASFLAEVASTLRVDPEPAATVAA